MCQVFRLGWRIVLRGCVASTLYVLAKCHGERRWSIHKPQAARERGEDPLQTPHSYKAWGASCTWAACRQIVDSPML
eukprot:362220-Chlamydomonas_euryale.AAC.10